MLDLGIFSRVTMRIVRQTEIAECGLASLTMVANHHGLDIDIGSMRRRFVPSLRGTTLRTLMGVADKIGLSTRAVKLPLEAISKLHVPAILHWDMNHYVVLERVHRGKALIHNPNGRSIWMTFDEVSPHFTGVALELRPNESFEQGNQSERLRLSQLWRRITGLKRALVQTLVLSIILQMFILASPYYMQIAVDRAIPALDQNLLPILALGFGLFTLFNMAASLLRSFVLLSAGTAVGYGLATNIARRLLRLPIDWFEKRSTGDILSRFRSITPIQVMLTQGAVAAVLDGILAIFTLAMMFLYSATLAWMAILSFALYAAFRMVSFTFEREAKEASIINGGKEQTILIETLRGITTLRLFCSETLRHALWQTRLADAVNSEVLLARVGIWQTTAKGLIFGIEAIISVWFAISYVIGGSGFSIGMVFAYMAYKGQFILKAEALIDQAIAFRMLGLHLERLSDIALAPEDIGFVAETDQHGELIGAIKASGIYFRYAPSDPLILSNINLEITAGEHVAITGPSGSGKSTLAKIMLGLLEPEQGEILIDGVPLKRFGYQNFRRQIAAVLQDDSLFSGTISHNIALFDESINQARVIAAAQAAAIHDDIVAMAMQYDTLVGDMGSTLSGGQKQRILLARALYRRPKILLMDEGTAHLDSVHESKVNQSIRKLGITRIIIAHRKETIDASDRIVILSNGQLKSVC